MSYARRRASVPAPPVLRAAGLVVFYVAVTCVMTWPYVDYTHLSLASYEGDARLVVWILAWLNHAVLDGLPLFRANIFFPAPTALAYNEHLFAISLFTLPWAAAGASPVLAYTATWWMAFVLNGLTAYAWARRFVTGTVAAVAGSLVFAYSFFVMLHAHGHLQLLWLWPLPLSLLLLERWFDRPTPARAAAWLLTLVLQLLGSGYLALVAVVGHAVVGLGLVATDRSSRSADDAAGTLHRWRLRVIHLAIGSVVAAALVLPFVRHYGGLRADSHGVGGATWSSYVIPPANTVAGRWWLAHVDRRPTSIWGESSLFVGWVVLALAVPGVVVAARARGVASRVRVLPALVAIGFVLSLGPAPAILGGLPLAPFAWLSSLPGFSAVRAPERFAVLVVLGLAGLTALGADAVLRRGGRGARILVALAVPVMLLEWFVVDFPAGPPAVHPVPAIYRALPPVPTGGLVSLPDYRGTETPYLNADYMLYSTAHWWPIVNGFGRAEPPGHEELVHTMRGFPGTAAEMHALGVRFVVLHGKRFPDGGVGLVAAARACSSCQLAHTVGDDYLYELVAPTSAASVLR